LILLALWLGSAAGAMAQRPEDVPGLEDLDSIPAASGYRRSICHIVYIDTLGVRRDSSLQTRRLFDERGRIIEQIGYDGLDEAAYTQKWEYDVASGLVRRSTKRSEEYNEVVADWWYTHDKAGRLIHAEDSISKVAADYRYGNGTRGAPCIAISVTGRYRYSGIDTYCDPTGRIIRQVGYIAGSDTVVSVSEYPDAGRRTRTVYSDNNQRVRKWTYLFDSAGNQVGEEYGSGTPERIETLYTISRTFEKGLLRRTECRNPGVGDWVEYYEYL
jgi:hypothetical protein